MRLPSQLQPFPPHLLHHPIVTYETRRLPWSGKVYARTRRWIALISILVLSGWGIALLIVRAERYFRLDIAAWIGNASLGYGFFLLMLAFLSGYILDAISVSTAVDSIHREIVARRWDLLRVTPISEGGLILAKHTAAQVRAWRSTVFVVTLRTLSLMMIGIGFIIVNVFSNRPYQEPISFANSIAAFAVIVVAALYGMLDAIWRMRTCTAIGLWISARENTGVGSTLMGMGALLGWWLLQGLFVIGFFFATSIYFALVGRLGSFGLLLVVIASLIPVLGWWGIHRLVQDAAIRSAARRVKWRSIRST